jgi:hypothetical protein
MKRREFITLLGATAWPLRAHVQRFDEMRLIGLLGGASPEAYNPFLSALHRGMRAPQTMFDFDA